MKKTKPLKGPDSNRLFSSVVLDGPDRAASRGMLYAVGFKPEDFQKPQPVFCQLPVACPKVITLLEGVE